MSLIRKSSSPVDHLDVGSPSTPSYSFNFGRLPYELRAKVVAEAAHHGMASNRTTHALQLVCKEFHQVVVPYIWSRLLIRPLSTLDELRTLNDTVLSRYGSFVKTASSYRDHWSPVAKTDRWARGTELAQAMANMPNLQHLDLHRDLIDFISLSPHFASLTHLTFFLDGGVEPIIASVTTIISHSSNIVSLTLRLNLHALTSTHEQERPLFIAAVASLQYLTLLDLACGDLADDAFATAAWKCPLTTLVINEVGTVLSLSTFRTFVSHFSTTLTSLEVNTDLPSWGDPPLPLASLPLPHLVTLHLTSNEPNEKTSLRLPNLFDNSPIEVASFDWEDEDDEGTDAMTTRFIQVHSGSLKRLCTPSFSEYRGASLPRLRELRMHAREMGVELVYFDD